MKKACCPHLSAERPPNGREVSGEHETFFALNDRDRQSAMKRWDVIAPHILDNAPLAKVAVMAEACDSPSDLGKIRFNPTDKSLELCT
jgi:hypothetical protein